MLFLVLNFKIEETTDDFVLNLKREWVKEQKRWKYLKVRGKMLRLYKSLISDEQLKRLIFKILLIYFEKTEVKWLWSVLLIKRTKREQQ